MSAASAVAQERMPRANPIVTVVLDLQGDGPREIAEGRPFIDLLNFGECIAIEANRFVGRCGQVHRDAGRASRRHEALRQSRSPPLPISVRVATAEGRGFRETRHRRHQGPTREAIAVQRDIESSGLPRRNQQVEHDESLTGLREP